MTVSKIRLNGTDHDIRAKYLIQNTSADAVSAEFSARAVTGDAIANIQKIYGNTVAVSDNPVSNSATAILSIEFNHWDEKWKNGRLNSSGNENTSQNGLLSATFFPVLPSTTYYFYCGGGYTGGTNMMVCQYKADKSFIMRNASVSFGGSITTQATTAYMKFCIPTSVTITSYGNNVCVNIFNSAKNGTYEPYNGHQIDLNIPTLTGKLNGTGSSVVIFPNGMQSNGTTRDELTATSATKKIADDNSVLSTPQEYILDNALQLQYPVVAGGTEMVLPTAGTAPMKMDVIYGNAADAAATMSQNFISVDSMKEFLSALGTQMGGTWSMGYENGKHTFTFTSN